MPMRTSTPRVDGATRWRRRRPYRVAVEVGPPAGARREPASREGEEGPLSERADGPDDLGDHPDAVDVPGHALGRVRVGQVDLDDVTAVPTGQPDTHDPRVGRQPVAEGALRGSGGRAVGHAPMVPCRAAR